MSFFLYALDTVAKKIITQLEVLRYIPMFSPKSFIPFNVSLYM